MKNALLAALTASARQPLADAPDADLLGRFTAGRDEAAFAELARRYGPLVWRTARTALGTGPDAEDVFQATFLALARHARSVRRPDALAGWLHHTAYRLAVRVRRRNARVPAPAPPSGSADPLDRLTARELLAAVDEGIAALPEKYRVPLLLCGVEGLSQDDVAKRLGWSAGSVKGRLERGRRKLRAWLEARGLVVPATLGGAVVVPMELTASVAAVIRGESASPAVAKLVAEVTGMSVPFWCKLVGVAGLMVGGLTTAVLMSSDPVLPPPTASSVAAPPKNEPLVLWSAAYPTAPDGKGTEGFVAGVWTPDGKHVLAAGSSVPENGKARSGEVRVWDAATGKIVHVFRVAADSFYGWDNRGLAISPDGKIIAVCGNESKKLNRLEPSHFVEVWSWGQKAPRFKLTDLPGSPITEVAISPDGETLAAVNRATEIQTWNLDTGKTKWSRQPGVKEGNRYNSDAIAFDPTGKVLVINRSLNFAFWDARTYQPLGGGKIEKGLQVGIDTLAFSPNGKRIAVGTGVKFADGFLAAVFDINIRAAADVKWSNYRELQFEKTDGVGVNKVAFSPDSKDVAAACSDGWVRVFDSDTAEQKAAAKEHTNTVSAVAFSPDGKQLLSVGRDAVKVWSVAGLMKRKP